MNQMEELAAVLTQHARMYPKMEPTDAVKLIYQNEFGGGHLITDEAACLDSLRREYAAVELDSTVQRCVNIGNGMLRIHLNALSALEVETLGRDFIESARNRQGSMPRFLEKLDVLRSLTEKGVFQFDSEALDRYLTVYLEAGCPCVSHSETYRRQYRPAYRIITK